MDCRNDPVKWKEKKTEEYLQCTVSAMMTDMRMTQRKPRAAAANLTGAWSGNFQVFSSAEKNKMFLMAQPLKSKYFVFNGPT